MPHRREQVRDGQGGVIDGPEVKGVALSLQRVVAGLSGATIYPPLSVEGEMVTLVMGPLFLAITLPGCLGQPDPRHPARAERSWGW